jgi:hypothetical protein
VFEQGGPQEAINMKLTVGHITASLDSLNRRGCWHVVGQNVERYPLNTNAQTYLGEGYPDPELNPSVPAEKREEYRAALQELSCNCKDENGDPKATPCWPATVERGDEPQCDNARRAKEILTAFERRRYFRGLIVKTCIWLDQEDAKEQFDHIFKQYADETSREFAEEQLNRRRN